MNRFDASRCCSALAPASRWRAARASIRPASSRWTFSTPRRSCRAIDGRCSRKALRACRRACRRSWSRATKLRPSKRKSSKPAQQAAPAEAKPKPKPKPKVVAKPKEEATAAANPRPEAQSQTQWPDPPPTQQRQPAGGGWPGSTRPSGGIAWPRSARAAIDWLFELHGRHCRPAKCRQVDAVQPPRRQAPRIGR